MGFFLKDEFEGVILALEFDGVGFLKNMLLGKLLYLFLELERFILVGIWGNGVGMMGDLWVGELELILGGVDVFEADLLWFGFRAYGSFA